MVSINARGSLALKRVVGFASVVGAAATEAGVATVHADIDGAALRGADQVAAVGVHRPGCCVNGGINLTAGPADGADEAAAQGQDRGGSNCEDVLNRSHRGFLSVSAGSLHHREGPGGEAVVVKAVQREMRGVSAIPILV